MTMHAETLTVEPARRIDDVEFSDVAVELVVLDLSAATVRGTEFVDAAPEVVEGAEGVEAVEGAERIFRLLRVAGVSIALTTGRSRETMKAIIDMLGWRDVIDVALCAEDAGRDMPFPDLPLTALMRTGAASVDSMVIVGDTVDAMRTGLAVGAGLNVGVLTGAPDAEQLHQAGADEVLESIAVLPAMLGVSPEV
ncbi:HAD family hydrolase [Paramicrobacterium fandaimingii]|uniref:HAD family hydrolase n=1 Tax=Paramicrobacterium fandaimingii TaxID=2708079 RepID=UPI001423766D|nr:HAD family hydrolase [Microbacterium fandaimingii]